MNELSEVEIKAMRHAVGADARRGVEGYRNRYVVPIDSDGDRMWLRLVGIGYASSSNRSEPVDGCVWYEVTKEGCAAIGLSKAAVVRACGSS